jgi:hypothetical protein
LDDLWQTLRAERFVRPLRARPFRAVESQHLISTRKLVDSDDEQRVLEELIERNKPPHAAGTAGLHYLLSTPFRYPPLPHGSRFGTRFERGIWYGSLEQRATLAEVAYYRLLFVEGSNAALTPLELELTLFRVRVRTRRGVDLTASPFAAHESEISSKTRYQSSHSLGRAMRDAGVEAFRYRSARDAQGGVNLAVIQPRAFAEKKPHAFETWWCHVERDGVECMRKSHLDRSSVRFLRDEFLVRGKLPSPSV